MATVVPPPSKRQKREISERAKTQQDVQLPADGGSLKIRFIDHITGLPTANAPIILSQADVTQKNLELIFNQLQGHDSSNFIPYRFEVIVNNKPLSLAQLATETLETEVETEIRPLPQAVFRVQKVSRCSATISGHGEPILCTQFSPRTSSRMASGSGDKTARIWDCDTGTPVHTLKGHTGWVLAVSWSPDESLLATGSHDKTVRIWDPKTGKCLGNSMKGHTKFVRQLSWEPYHLQKPGEPRVASASEDSTVRIWFAKQQKIDMVLSGHTGSVSIVKWGGAGFIYTASHDKTVKVWNAKDGTLAHTLSAHAHWVNHLALSTDFALRTGFFDHKGKVPETEEEKIEKAKKRYMDVATIKGEVVERLVSASDDFTMYLWEPSKGKKPLQRMVGHQKQVNHVTFSPDGQFIASTGFDNHTKIWGSTDGKFINTLRGHVAPVYQCAFSPDSRLLVTCSKDTTLKVWDMATYKLSVDLPGHQDQVFAVDWSPDGQKVGSGGADKAIKLWRH